MASHCPPPPTDFLASDPVPIQAPAAQPPADPADQLPSTVVEQLMRTDGVDGVWIERSADGQRIVVLHYSYRGSRADLPSSVEGMPTRIVDGGPIKAQ